MRVHWNNFGVQCRQNKDKTRTTANANLTTMTTKSTAPTTRTAGPQAFDRNQTRIKARSEFSYAVANGKCAQTSKMLCLYRVSHPTGLHLFENLLLFSAWVPDTPFRVGLPLLPKLWGPRPDTPGSGRASEAAAPLAARRTRLREKAAGWQLPWASVALGVP